MNEDKPLVFHETDWGTILFELARKCNLPWKEALQLPPPLLADYYEYCIYEREMELYIMSLKAGALDV